jgi:hypothetical protein
MSFRKERRVYPPAQMQAEAEDTPGVATEAGGGGAPGRGLRARLNSSLFFWGLLGLNLILSALDEFICLNLVGKDVRRVGLVLFWVKLWVTIPLLHCSGARDVTLLRLLLGPLFIFYELSRAIKLAALGLALTAGFYTAASVRDTYDKTWSAYMTAASYSAFGTAYLLVCLFNLAELRFTGRDAEILLHPLIILLSPIMGLFSSLYNVRRGIFDRYND